MRVRHVTTYTYDEIVPASYSEARLTPLTTADQYVRRSKLDVSPTPWSQEYRDYWGTTVQAFEVTDPHDELVVVSTSNVDTADETTSLEPMTWEQLAHPDVQDEYCEFLTLSDATAIDEELAGEVERLRAGAATPAEFVAAACDLVRTSVTRLVAATHVTATARETWETRKGVAHDLAHLAIGVLRTAGIPARFVAGYRHPDPVPEVGATVETEHHAWLEWFDGSWIGHDVAFGETPGERHVIVSVGREFSDSPPMRGIYASQGPAHMDVLVEITRVL